MAMLIFWGMMRIRDGEGCGRTQRRKSPNLADL